VGGVPVGTTISQVVLHTPNTGTINNLTTTSFDFIPNINNPFLCNNWIILSYVPVCPNGQDGGTAFIFIYLGQPTLSQTITNGTNFGLGDVVDIEITVCNNNPDYDMQNPITVNVQLPPELAAVGASNIVVSPLLAGNCTTFVAQAQVIQLLTCTGSQPVSICSTIDNPSGICNSLDCDNINVVPPGNFALTLSDPTGNIQYSTSALANNPPPSGSVILVEGNLVIDQSCNWSDWNFKLEKDPISGVSGQITVNANVNMIVNNCLFYACEEMWKGIDVFGNGSFNMNKSTISDAEYGITAEEDANVILFSNTFSRNYVGLFVPPNLSNLPAVTLHNNVYTGGSLLPHSNPAILTWSKAGMEINDIALIIQNEHFSDLCNGVLAYDTYLGVKEPFFTNIINTYDNYNILNYFGQNVNGTGIYVHGTQLQNTHLAVYGTGMGINAPSNFDNCHIGIYTENGETEVYDVKMTQVNNGIYLSLATQNSVNYLVGNSIEADNSGIFISLADAALQTDIIGNNILMNNNSSIAGEVGIGFVDFWGGVQHANIYSNQIQTNDTYRGIWAQNLTGDCFIANNGVLIQSSTQATEGIQLYNTDYAHISCNQVTGQGIENALGYRIERSRAWDISCNTSNHTEIGMMFVNDCTSDNKLKGNNIDNHSTGLLVRNNSYFGKQVQGGNAWLATIYTGEAAQNDNPSYNLSYVYVNPNDGWEYNPTQVYPLAWFQQDFSGNAWDACPSLSECSTPYYGKYHEGLGDTDWLIASQGIEDSLYRPELQYSSNRYLYKKLKDSTDLVPDSGLVSNFYLTQQQNSVGQFTDIQDAFQAQSLSLATQQNLAAQQVAMQNIMGQIAEKDSLMAEENDTLILHTLQAQSQILHAQCDSLRSSRRNTYQLIAAQKNLLSDNLHFDNQTVVATALIEQNERSLNALYLSTVGSRIFTFNEVQKATIADIATQCPYTGGEAVYRARALHFALTGESHFDDATICNNEGIAWRQAYPKEQATVPFSVQVIPNPASDKGSFVFTAPTSSTQIIFIYNSLGQKIAEYRINEEEKGLDFSTENYASGMYYYTVGNLQGKFIVEK
jgi:hypothetical protein